MRFLVIQTRDIGDVLISTALCNALAAAHPGSSVDMLTMSHCAGVVVGNPNIDRIIVLDSRRRNEVGYMLKFLRNLRRNRYDVVVNVQGQIIGLLCSLATLDAKRIGFAKPPWSLLNSTSVPFRAYPTPSGMGLTLDDRFALLEPVGAANQERSFRIWLTPDELARGRMLLADAGLDPSRPIIALGINSRDDYKRWPLGHFARLAERLLERYDVQVLVFFAPNEEQYSLGLRAQISPSLRERVCDRVRTRDIRELAMVFAHCALYLGNDTGPRHIAQALDTPSFAVVSPASDKWGWIPWSSVRHRAVDVGDAVGLTREQWLAKRRELVPGSPADQAEFARLSVDFVEAEVQRQIESLAIAPVRAVTALEYDRAHEAGS